jgi:RNA polymerase sigma-54 factor
MVLQIQSPSLRPQTTAHLAQTMTLLSLTAAELKQEIEAAIDSNPALELTPVKRCANCRRPLNRENRCPVCSHPESAPYDDPVVFVSTREDYFFNGELPAEELPEDNFSVAREELATYVLRQIATELEPEDRSIAVHILTGLDENGLLGSTLFEIAQFHHVPLQRVERVVQLIQHADPVGVGSPSPQEALLVQIEILSETHNVPAHAERAIRDGMELLSRHRYSELGRLLEVPTREARRIAQFISDNLYPFPARAHWGDIRQNLDNAPPVFHNPDVIFSLLNDSQDSALVVEILLPISGTLAVNRAFREAVRQAPPDKSDDWKAYLENAALLVKCLRQRNHTMVRLMKYLARHQRRFVMEGNLHLESMTRARIAEVLGVHESTISRAVSDKTIQLPNGRIIPLAQFFDRSLPVRTVLKSIIQEESKPMSDSQLRIILAQKGFEVARRTVAKYRAMEGILPAHLRGQPASPSPA